MLGWARPMALESDPDSIQSFVYREAKVARMHLT